MLSSTGPLQQGIRGSNPVPVPDISPEVPQDRALRHTARLSALARGRPSHRSRLPPLREGRAVLPAVDLGRKGPHPQQVGKFMVIGILIKKIIHRTMALDAIA